MIEQLLTGLGITFRPANISARDGGTRPGFQLVGPGGALDIGVEIDDAGTLCLEVFAAGGSVAVWAESDLVLGGEDYEDD